MKSPLFFLSCLAVAILCLGGVGCEQHPVPDTVKDQAKQKAEQPGAEANH
jgi:hypothetical protein